METNISVKIIEMLDEQLNILYKCKSVQELSEKTIQIIHDYIPYDFTGFYLYDNKHQTIKLSSSKGLIKSEDEDIQNSFLKSYVGYVVQNKKILLENDCLNQSLFLQKNPISLEDTVQSRLYVPITYGDQCLGTLGLVFCKSNMYTNTDVVILKFISKVVGVALTNLSYQHETEINLNRVKSLVNNMNAAIMIEDHERKIVHVNQLFCNFFKIPAEPSQLIGVDCSQSAQQTKALFAEPEQFVADVDELLKNQTKFINQKIRMSDGRILERDYVPLTVDNEYRGHMWCYRDITVVSLTQERIRREHKMIRRMIRAAPVAIAIFNNEYKSIVKSQTWKSSTEIDEVLKQHWKLNGSLIKRGEITQIPFQAKDALGELKHFNAVVGPWTDDSGEIAGFIVVCSAVSEFVEEKEKAVNESKMKSQFLANMSHEIRTPMNGVLGMVEMLKLTELNKDQRDYIDTISNSADSLLCILNDILDFSKIEAGKVELSPIEFNLYKYINSTVKTFSPIAKKKSLEVELKYDVPRDLIIKSDPVRVRQVLSNLLSNAIKFTTDGSVTVHIDSKSDVNSDKNIISFSVKDSGIGMAEETIEKIFKPFEQADGSTSRKFGGTGLGLAITKNLVELMGGEIKVTSVLNEGTTFTFLLPVEIIEKANVQHEQIQINSDESSEVLKTLNVLIAEDNAVNQQVFSLMLDSLGVKFTMVGNGIQALEAYQNTKFDVLLLDCQMPIMDGYTTAEDIRVLEKCFDYEPLKIIALTAHAYEEEKQKCFAAGMNGFLSKPVTIQAIKDALLDVAQEVREKKSDTIVEKVSSIDMQQIMQLKNLAGHDVKRKNEFFHKINESFEKSVPSKLSDLKSHLKNEDYVQLSRSAHALKSDLSTFGLRAMAQVALKIEKEASLKQNEALLKSIQEIENNYLDHYHEACSIFRLAS